MSGPIIEAAIYRMPENENEIDGFIGKWRGTVDHVREPAVISGQFAEDEKFRQRAVPCKNLQERLTIFWNGDVCLCHADLNGLHYFGNMKDMTIRDAWNGGGLPGFRRKHRDREFSELPICASCDWV